MSKSKVTRKWADEDYDPYEDRSERQKQQDRRHQKKIKNALRSKNFDVNAFVGQDD